MSHKKYNPHSTRTANAAREFIRWGRALRAPNGETPCRLGSVGAERRPSPTGTEESNERTRSSFDLRSVSPLGCAMREYKMKPHFMILILLFISGCAPSIYVDSISDIRHSFKKSDGILVHLPKNSGVEEKNFHYLLQKSLQDRGFWIVYDIQYADEILMFSLDEKTSEIKSALPYSSTSTTKGKVTTPGDLWGTGYEEKTTTTQFIPYSYNYTVSKVYMFMFKVNDQKVGDVVWEGYLGSGQKNFSKYPMECVDKLMEYYGTNFKGHVRINTY